MHTSLPTAEFLDFVSKSPTAFHAIQQISQLLKQHSFSSLDETETWNLTPGGKYYVTKNGSSIIAFVLPFENATHFQIISSHADSPMLKLKTLPESPACNCYLRLNAEVYGGMIMSTWLDRPLSIAGRLVVKNTQVLSTVLVNLDKDTTLIPNMPIHFNREINDGYKFNPQIDLLPLYGDIEDKGILLKHLAECAHVSPEQIVDSDLFLYNRMPGSIWGAHQQFFSCPRIDDLECCFTSLRAFVDTSAAPTNTVPVLAVFDNEEVGSTSKQGAASSFLFDCFSQIHTHLSISLPLSAMIARSMMVSADNAHAVHPNHSEKYDEQNRVYMNKGVVIKHSANQKYTTDAVSSSIFATICSQRNIPIQHFSNRSDIRGGSTLGNIANTHTSMNTVDIGLAQLAMHSSYETAGVTDLESMTQALQAFYQSNICISGNGQIQLL